MARKKKKEEDSGGEDKWLLPFLSLMLVVLVFFIFLVTHATFEDRRKIELVIESLHGTFGEGLGPGKVDVLDQTDIERALEPGPMPDDGDLQQLKPLLWDDKTQDLNFVEGEFVQVFTVNSEVLFQPGEVELTPEGTDLLDKIVPVLQDLEYPVLLAGHTSLLRDEFGVGWEALRDQEIINPSWELSLDRVLNVYRYVLEQGVDPEMIRVEAFGKFQPRYSNRTEQGRSNNRRVDIVLDKRNPEWTHARAEEAAALEPEDPQEYEHRDFLFELN